MSQRASHSVSAGASDSKTANTCSQTDRGEGESGELSGRLQHQLQKFYRRMYSMKGLRAVRHV
jgi:hypothetical protein